MAEPFSADQDQPAGPVGRVEAEIVASHDEPFACPNCGQMLGASCRVCVSCHQPIDTAAITRPPAPSPAATFQPSAAPVEIARFSPIIFLNVLAIWVVVSYLAARFLSLERAQLLMGGVVVLSTAWVYSDARRKNIPHPFRWGLGTLLFWILVFPWYLSRRRTPLAPSPLMESKANQFIKGMLLIAFLIFVVVVVAGLLGRAPK